jgi:hypothetical protein
VHHMQHRQQQHQHHVAVPAGGCSVSSSVSWAVMQQEEGFRLLQHRSCGLLSSTPAWRRLLGPWGSWHLFKAQAVSRFPRTVAMQCCAFC